MKNSRSKEKMKMRRWKKILIIIIFGSIITGVGIYFSLGREEYVTGDAWAPSKWRVEDPSYAEFTNGSFSALAYQPSRDFFGACLIQQGDSPHGWWNPSEKLGKNITIYRDKEQPLILHFVGKRTSPIEWFNNDPQNCASNIGVLLVGDVGLDYYNNDTSEPHALFIDIWLDTNPEVNRTLHWPGVKDVENDYHSGFSVETMPEIGEKYEFKFRIDQIIKDALNRWKLESFTLKMVQCYVEAKASKASIEVSKILIVTQ